MPKAQAPYIFPPKDLLLTSREASIKRTWPLEL